MATVDISTGVQMKQRESKRDEAEEGEGRRHHRAVMSLEANEGVELLKEQQKKQNSIILNCSPDNIFYSPHIVSEKKTY